MVQVEKINCYNIVKLIITDLSKSSLMKFMIDNVNLKQEEFVYKKTHTCIYRPPLVEGIRFFITGGRLMQLKK